MAIIGGGPAGLLLSHILHRNGIDSIVLERQSRRHVLSKSVTMGHIRSHGFGDCDSIFHGKSAL